MRFRWAILGLAASLLISCSVKNETAVAPLNVEGVSPNASSTSEASTDNGLVGDEQAAVEIAVREWTRMGFKEQIDQQRPYRAELIGDVWEVSGTAPKNWIGGLAYARISQKDGTVLRAWHDK